MHSQHLISSGGRWAVGGGRFAICDLRFAVCGLRFAVCDRNQLNWYNDATHVRASEHQKRVWAPDSLFAQQAVPLCLYTNE